MKSQNSGYLQFGNMMIPVRMYSATQKANPSFHRVHKTDKGHLRMEQVCSVCGESLNADNTMKEYEIGGQMVYFTNEEVQSYKPAKSETIRTHGFVNRSEIDDVMFNEHHYYVGTADKKKGAFDKFHLLRHAMVKAKKVAIIGWVSHDNDHLGMLEPFGDGFLLMEMHFASGVRGVEEMPIETASVVDDHVDIAVKIIKKFSMKFDHAKYHAEYSALVAEAVEARLKGEVPEVTDEVKITKKVDSLTDELMSSLA